MKRITEQDIQGMEKVFRLNLINSITGYKPANLIGTAGTDGETNLAIFSSVVHLGSNPPFIGMFTRPTTVPRHTYENIKATGRYTINHVQASFVAQAHYTSADFPREESEFTACGLTPEYLNGFSAPYVQESQIKMGLELVEEVSVQATGTIMLVGKVIDLYLPENLLRPDGTVDLNGAGDVAISGLDAYHTVQELAAYEYARAGQGPREKTK
ncbi:flavin reductase family protein [Hymenobacter crusticola]|uniref:Flavin oxidoreductase n=1 Tax=Hymenobacter crusticola TaxID=1770526 RepID=A0A243WGI1_9BACT|nr:flavin reductase family protein [Hymenobacter crusticola]OUJ74854.1 flavin oxidoreductase [Hymenobacter crusticola]